MDRQIVYPGQILPETTLLQMAKDAMIGSAKLAAAMLGTSTIANGFAVTPTGPASLQIVVAPGEIYALANIDSLAFSTLPADTTHSILKQGIMLDGVTLSCPAPTTTGQSINYLVQATYQDQDSTPVLLPYYNSANPAMPYSGMGNNGLTQNTSRKGVAIVQVKAGASAATGSQVTPAPDSGYIGLFVVSVSFGQTVINSGSITQYIGAPLLPSGIIQSIQSGNTTFALDIGTVNACAATFSPAVTISDSLVLRFKASNTNTGPTTFSPNGIAAAPVVGGNHAALQGGEIVATGDVWVQWNSSIGGGSWVLIDGTGGALQVSPATKSLHAVNARQIQNQAVTAFTTSGTSPAFTLTPVPASTGYSVNQRFQVIFSDVGGAAPTLNVSALGAKNLKQYTSTGSKVAATVVAGQIADVVYDGTDLVVLDQLPSSSTPWASITSTPTTVVGYGITDAMPTAGGNYRPTFSSLYVNSTLGNVATNGGYIAWNSQEAGLTGEMNFLCNQGGGAGGFTWRTVNVNNTATGPTMSYSYAGALSVPTSLSVPAITSNTTAPTQAAGTSNTYIANCAFVANATQQSTETTQGTSKIATQLQTNTGSDDATSITPKKLKFGFLASLAANGYIVFPAWLGGFIVQWGQVASGGTSGTLTFPLAFPTALRSIVGTPAVSGSGGYNLNFGTSLTTTTINWGLSIATSWYWIAVGS